MPSHRRKRKATKIVDLDVEEVALVDRPATGTPFLLFKKDTRQEDLNKDSHPSKVNRVRGDFAPDDMEWDAGEETAAMDVSQIAAGSVIFRGVDPENKGSYSLLIRNRDGAIVPNAVRNARARVSQIEGVSASVISDAEEHLGVLMDQIQERKESSASKAEANTVRRALKSMRKFNKARKRGRVLAR